MVVMLNGYVIYSPIIDEQISNGILVIPHPMPPRSSRPFRTSRSIM